MKLKQIILGLSGILLMGACQDSPFFIEYQSVDVKEWHSADSLVYVLPKVENTSIFDMSVNVRSSHAYKYSNLALVVKIKEGKKTLSVDTLTYTTQKEDGKSIGIGLSFVEHNKSLGHKIELMPKKKYKVKITHIMRLDPLEGMTAVGVEINEPK